jgi:uncharacterized protein YigA (DUF484 family)
MTAKLESLVRAAVAEAVGPLREGHERLEERIEKLEETSAENNKILNEQEARAKLLAEQKEEERTRKEAERTKRNTLIAVFTPIVVALISAFAATIASHH